MEGKTMSKIYPQFTTIENLQASSSGSYGVVLKYAYNVLVADISYKGFTAAVYEFADTPEETGFSDIECRISLIKESDKYFEDNGSAIAWAFKQIQQ
jgi:hypothetical protein